LSHLFYSTKLLLIGIGTLRFSHELRALPGLNSALDITSQQFPLMKRQVCFVKPVFGKIQSNPDKDPDTGKLP
jgi:hypothetical protein